MVISKEPGGGNDNEDDRGPGAASQGQHGHDSQRQDRHADGPAHVGVPGGDNVQRGGADRLGRSQDGMVQAGDSVGIDNGFVDLREDSGEGNGQGRTNRQRQDQCRMRAENTADMPDDERQEPAEPGAPARQVISADEAVLSDFALHAASDGCLFSSVTLGALLKTDTNNK
ncbi:hypothetical protein ACOM2C_10560 [Pseudarthrobacter sp. So.54]